MPSPTLEEVQEIMFGPAMDGWCTTCEEWTHDYCEPDAREYKCPACRNKTCYGAEELLIMGLVE